MSQAERSALYATVYLDPDNEGARLALADWLDEHDEPEEANRQRYLAKQRPISKAWLLDFAKLIGEDYDFVIQSAKHVGEIGGADTVDCGINFVADGSLDEEEDRKIFWQHVEIILEQAFSPAVHDNPVFRCGCG